MNNLEEFKNYTDYYLKEIEMTATLKKKIVTQIKKENQAQFKKIAVIFLPLCLILIGLANEPIGYAIEKFLSYLPSSNQIFYGNNDSPGYGLLGSVKVADNDVYIKVNSAYSEGNQLTFTVDGNVPIEDDLEQNIKVINNQKEEGKLISIDSMTDLSDNKWSARCVYTFENPDNQFNIICKNFNVPLICSALPAIPTEQQNYVTNQHIKADIAAISQYNEEGLEISILSQALDANQQLSFPMEAIYLIDNEGNKYYSQYFKDNKLYFNRKLEQDIRLIIPYIFIEDKKEKVEIKMYKEMPMPLNFKLGQHMIQLKDISWNQYTEPFNYKTPDKKLKTIENSAQKLILNFNSQISDMPYYTLEQLSILANSDQINIHVVEDVKVIWEDHYQNVETNTSTLENQITFQVLNLKKEIETVNLTFSNPVYKMLEEVVIPLRP